MSKHLTLSGLQTVLPPIKHLIDKKAENVDWNENDPSSKGYVKNRPFYETVAEEIIFNHQNLEFEDWDGIYGAESEFPSLTVGDQYNIIWDKEVYSCTPIPNNEVTFIGNVGLLGGPETGEPFVIINYDEGWAEILTPDTSLTHTIQISSIVPEIKKIDEKFLPKGSQIGMAGEAEGAEIFNDYENNKATNHYSHAEGNSTTASGVVSHAEGNNTTASGGNSHAEGNSSIASGNWGSHAEGLHAIASGNTSHAEGYYTTAASHNQHVQGKYNRVDSSSTYAHIVGNGTSSSARSNAHALDWDGNAYFAGDVYVNGDGADNFANNKKLATEEFVINQIPTIPTVPNNGNILNGITEGSLRTIGSTEEWIGYKLGEHAFATGFSSKAEGNYSHVQGKNSYARTRSINVIGEYNLIEEEPCVKKTIATTINFSDFDSVWRVTLSSNQSNTSRCFFMDSKVEYLSISNINIGDYIATNMGDEWMSEEYYEVLSINGDSIECNRHYKETPANIRGKYAHIVGNGTDTTRSNAHTLDWSGNAWYQGDVYVGGSGQDDAAAKKLATEEFVAAPRTSLTLVDEVTGENYIVCIRNGSLVTYKAE